jgi:WD40 repeat protein
LVAATSHVVEKPSTITKFELQVWETQTGKRKWGVTEPFGDSLPGSLVFAPDGKTLAAGSDKDIKLYDPETGAIKKTLTGSVSKKGGGLSRFSRDGKTIASVGEGADTFYVNIWNAAEGKELHAATFKSARLVRVGLSADGSTLLIHIRPETGAVHKIVIWDVKTGKERRSFTVSIGDFSLVELSPDGKTMASNDSRAVRIWDVKSGKERKPIPVTFFGLAYTFDGKFWLGLSRQTDVILVNSQTGKIRGSVPSGLGNVARYTLSGGGTVLALAGGKPNEERTIQIWDMKKGR